MAKSTLSYPNEMAIAGEMPELAMEVYSFFLPGLLRGFAPPHCPHLRAGKGCQICQVK